MRRYDFILVLSTVAILFALGFLSFLGAGYVWIVASSDPQWAGGADYQRYVDAMNAMSLPYLVALLVSLVLCIPRRIIDRGRLILLTLGMFVVAAAVGFAVEPRAGLLALILSSMAIQSLVLLVTVVKRGRARYITEGRFSQIGSALLHLGIAAFAYDIVLASTGSPLHTALYWVAVGAIGLGMISALYQKELARLGRQRVAGRANDEANGL